MPQQPSQKAVNQVEKLRDALANVGEIFFATVREYLDFVTRSHTAFPTFGALIHAPGDYFPSLMSNADNEGFYDPEETVHLSTGRIMTARKQYAELNFLALAYDMAQEVRQDPRRAYRS